MMRPMGIHEWWERGERVAIALRGADRHVWMRRLGAGPSLTLLHGFPSSSYDWARVVPELAERHELQLVDLLGFGASDKPADHEYSLYEQADLVEAIWSRAGITSTAVLAHDYSVTVAQELLARRAEGELSVELLAVHLLNGGVYPDLHRPVATQTALLDPEQGPRIAAAMTEELFAQTLRPTFGPGHDIARDSADIWQAIARGGVVLHRLIRFMPERAANADRWVGALEDTDVPLSFVWGML
ncbi:MAG: hypothetical protein QOG06_994, partial [Gaiellaceae bacterium]|nr:hypothetical protein [Gaiellaceae bacterium]